MRHALLLTTICCLAALTPRHADARNQGESYGETVLQPESEIFLNEEGEKPYGLGLPGEECDNGSPCLVDPCAEFSLPGVPAFLEDNFREYADQPPLPEFVLERECVVGEPCTWMMQASGPVMVLVHIEGQTLEEPQVDCRPEEIAPDPGFYREFMAALWILSLIITFGVARISRGRR